MTPLAAAARLAIAAAVFLGAATPADAQLIRTKPFRGLFRTTQNPADSKDSVDVSAFLAGAHDDLAVESPGVEGAADDRLRTATFGSLFLTGRYAHTGDTRTFSARIASSTRYYSAAPQSLTPMNLTGAVRFAAQVGRHGTVNLDQSYAYSPYYTFSLAPDFLAELDEESAPVFDADTDLRAARRATYTYRSGASYSHRLARRSRLLLGYAFNYTDSAAGAYDLMSHAANIRFSHGVGRYSTVYAGYGSRVFEYVDSPFGQAIGHDVDAGVGYARQLPFSRRTRVAFSVGSAVAAQEQSTRVYVAGTASLQHLFTRTWGAAVAYRRGADVLHGFAEPFFTFSDSVTAAFSGRLVGPVVLSGSGTYSRGTFSVQSTDNVVDSGWGSVRLNVPVIWFLAAYVEGYYAQYRFDRRVGLLADVPTSINRFGTRAGLSFWVPVLR